ncbi:uncharacterized protein [Dermacentor andersoni]|uniref:uncharacterized protein isoform X2 n=1 Tax=Dermacentor andersoni TaxID=34620 RepID=UPI003B3BC9A2
MASSSSINHAQPSTSRAGMEEGSPIPETIARISDDASRYQGNRQHMPMTDDTCNVDGVTDNGSTSCEKQGSIRSMDKATSSTCRASMEEPSANLEDGGTNAPGTGSREERELCSVCGNVSSRRDALHEHAKECTDDTAHICKASRRRRMPTASGSVDSRFACLCLRCCSAHLAWRSERSRSPEQQPGDTNPARLLVHHPAAARSSSLP